MELKCEFGVNPNKFSRSIRIFWIYDVPEVRNAHPIPMAVEMTRQIRIVRSDSRKICEEKIGVFEAVRQQNSLIEAAKLQSEALLKK